MRKPKKYWAIQKTNCCVTYHINIKCDLKYTYPCFNYKKFNKSVENYFKCYWQRLFLDLTLSQSSLKSSKLSSDFWAFGFIWFSPVLARILLDQVSKNPPPLISDRIPHFSHPQYLITLACLQQSSWQVGLASIILTPDVFLLVIFYPLDDLTPQPNSLARNLHLSLLYLELRLISLLPQNPFVVGKSSLPSLSSVMNDIFL